MVTGWRIRVELRVRWFRVQPIVIRYSRLIMIVVAVGMLIFFWRRGWIGEGQRKRGKMRKDEEAWERR